MWLSPSHLWKENRIYKGVLVMVVVMVMVMVMVMMIVMCAAT
jgi:hypothetical protein